MDRMISNTVPKIWGSELIVDEKYTVAKILVTDKGKTSVQVHPESDEVWHILNGEGRVSVSTKFNGVDNMVWFDVKPKETIFVPKGHIHCIGEGLVIMEFKEFEDKTIRVYDWGRKRCD